MRPVARAAVQALLCVVALVRPASAQLSLSGTGLVSVVEHRVNAGSGVEQSSGTTFGGVGRLGVGSALELTFQAASGELTADSAGADDRNLAEAEFRAAVLAVPWLALYAGVGVRSYATTFARQRWISSRLGAEARLAFVGGALRSVVRFELLPTVTVSGLEKPNRALAAGAGMEWRIGILTASILYSLERYDFPLARDVTRHEQLSALSAQLGLRVGRGL